MTPLWIKVLTQGDLIPTGGTRLSKQKNIFQFRSSVLDLEERLRDRPGARRSEAYPFPGHIRPEIEEKWRHPRV